MKIVFFHGSMQSGGIERTISLLSNLYCKQGDMVTIVTLDYLESFYFLLPPVNQIHLDLVQPSHGLTQAMRNNWRRIRGLRAALSASQPDVLISFGANTEFMAFLAKWGMGFKLVGAEQTNPYLSTAGFWNHSKRIISTLCDGFIFQTKEAARYYPVNTQKKSIIFQNGLIAQDFQLEDRPWEDRRHICAVGRMDVDKCFDELLTAFAKAHGQHPDVRLDLYGDGPLRAELEALSARFGLQACVVFHGRCSTMPTEYAKHKLFAMASRKEGLPNVLMEALASGCACVAANCDFGPSELIRDGENGFLVPVHDPDAMADRLCRLLEDDSLCQRFSQAAVSIRQTHDIENIGVTFRTFIEKL